MGRRKKSLFRAVSFVLLLLCTTGAVSYGQSFKDYRLKVKESFPHDVSGYTQGLFFHEGALYESTGQYGSSSFRKVDLNTGNIESRLDFPAEFFVEGSCAIENRLYVLTWYEETCFVYDINTFDLIAQFRYTGEGWGLTTDGNSLIMSDGTSVISFRDPVTFLQTKKITVRLNGREISYLNELEYINGKIWANIYGLDYILIIDPNTGNVEGRVDCNDLLESQYRNSYVDVLNGIAYNPEDGTIYLTGKYWPKLYEIALIEK
ncbi:MAG: glutaminyl-peptide cyclotransferase [Bacteroidales bacterium]|nr:glutaminyl-peptide cyclotransferase [Bacteroidales bacterium]